MTLNLARRVRKPLTDVCGVIDLASILVGVLVTGIIAGGILSTVFMVVPWAQDEAAKGDLSAVRAAQSVAQVQHDEFLDYTDLVEENLIQGSASVDIVLGDACYVATSASDSGTVFVSTSRSEGPASLEIVAASHYDWCADLPI